MTSQWIDNVVIDTKQSCDQQSGSFPQYPEKPRTFTQDPVGRKTSIFYLTTHHIINIFTPSLYY